MRNYPVNMDGAVGQYLAGVEIGHGQIGHVQAHEHHAQRHSLGFARNEPYHCQEQQVENQKVNYYKYRDNKFAVS